MAPALSQPRMTQKQEEPAVLTIRLFARAIDERDVHCINNLAHENFLGIVGEQTINKTGYLKMLWEKKLGGAKNTVEIIQLESSEKVATAKVRVIRGNEITDSVYHVVKRDGGWQVLVVLPYHVQKT